jgi:lysophospholipase L1-like esterase
MAIEPIRGGEPPWDVVKRTNLAFAEINRVASLAAQAPVPLMAALGDSITAQGFGGSTSLGHTFADMGYATWLAFLSRQRVQLSPLSNHGVSGENSEEIAARVGAALAINPGVLIVETGTNDLSLTLDQTIAARTKIYDAARAANVPVISLMVPPRGLLTSAQYGKLHQINAWDQSERYRRPNFFPVDPMLSYGDPTTGKPRATMSADEHHPNVYGAWAIANAILPVIERLFPNPMAPFGNLLDLYHATENPAGNLLASGVGLMVGTGGSLSNGPTGSLATGWSANGVNMPAGTTTVFAKTAKADGRAFQQVTFGGTYNVASPGNLNVTTASVHASCAAGDTLEATCELEADAGIENLAGAQLLLNCATPSGNPIPTDGAANNTYLLPPVAFSGIRRTAKVTLPATPTTVTAIMRFTAKGVGGSSNLAGVIRFGSVSIRKVSP